MSISKINFVESLKVNKNVEAVVSTLSYKEIISAVKNNKPEVFMALKGVGEKTAERIISVGKDLLVPTKVRFFIPHYAAPMYSFVNMLDSDQVKLLDKAAACSTVSEAIVVLRKLNAENDMAHGPLQCNGMPEYNALPASMLSVLLEIEPDTETNKICIFRFSVKPKDFLPTRLLDNAEPRQRSEINAIFNSLQESVISRAVEFGFTSEQGVDYNFYTCSPGQLKKQSGYWMEACEFKRHQRLFWGNLSPVEINYNTGFKPVPRKDAYGNLVCDKNGRQMYDWIDGKGIAMTKILQYRALLTSSCIPSSRVLGKKISLRNLICIGEFEKPMTANVMSVSADYNISEGERNDIMNNMFDGMMILNSKRVGWTMLQARAFGIKGLGVPVDWEGYCEYMGYNKNADCWLVTDVDGVVHDLKKETHIYGIVNTSVFKMLKIFGSWKHYVECMEELNMDELYVCNINDEKEETKRLSRQMMQSLFCLSNNEMEYLASDTVGVLQNYANIENAIEIMGETNREYDCRSNLGKLVSKYPDMLAESCVQKELKDRYIKQYNSAMCGELNVNGRYYFVAADPCAWMDIVFGKKAIDDPNLGWLKAGECRCDAYAHADELIVLRSPHAFMEWATLYQAKHCPFVQSMGIYTSVHDLTFRILQMDYDGDHLLVVDDEKLISIVKSIKERYQIPVVYYEPSVAPNPGPMPTRAHDFSMKIVECIQKCAEYNKVGQYSNLVTAAWSTYHAGMSRDELRSLLRDVAIIAAGINHAVDAQKTYHLDFLEECAKNVVDRYNFKPYNERFKNASPKKPHYDPSWDEETMSKADGCVDRLGDIVSAIVPNHLELDTSNLKFDWRMLKHPDPRFNKQLNQSVISPEMVRSIEMLCSTNNDEDKKLIDSMKAGDKIGFSQFLPLLKFLNNAFFSAYKDNEDDIVNIKNENARRIEILRRLIVNFARSSTAAEGMTNDEILMLAAMSALKMAYTARKYGEGAKDLRRFAFDVFGDKYAECVMLNMAANYNPVEEEVDMLPPFNPDDYCIPPMEDDMYGAFIGNELNDLY